MRRRRLLPRADRQVPQRSYRLLFLLAEIKNNPRRKPQIVLASVAKTRINVVHLNEAQGNVGANLDVKAASGQDGEALFRLGNPQVIRAASLHSHHGMGEGHDILTLAVAKDWAITYGLGVGLEAILLAKVGAEIQDSTEP